jgi:curli biogenesis system outer membrane secretion channel CsgG
MAPLWPVLAALSLALSAGCGSKPEYYRGDITSVQVGTRVAVLPLVNLCSDETAPDVVMNALVVELLATNRFTVVDPGIVEEAVQKERLRLTDRLPLAKLQALGAALTVDYVFVGSVNEFGMVRDLQEELPTVSIALRMVSCSTGNIVWAATHTKRGDDSESVFRLGRIGTLEKLTAVTAHEMMPTLLPDKQPQGSK